MSLKLQRLFVVALLILGLFASQSDAGRRISVSRTNASLVLSYRAASLFGGVMLQARAKFVDGRDAEIRPERVGLSHFDKKESSLYFLAGQENFALKVDEDSLDRIFSWIENGGVGVYSAARDLSEKELEEQGLTKLRSGNYIAKEFAESKSLEPLAHYLDFPQDRLLEEPEDSLKLQAIHNEGIEKAKSEEDLDYVVSDLDSAFTAVLKGGEVFLGGTVFRYNRSASTNKAKVYVTSIERFVFSNQEAITKRIVFPRNEEAKKAVARKHLDAIRFCQMAAVLRTVHAKNKASWDKFAQGYFVDEPAR